MSYANYDLKSEEEMSAAQQDAKKRMQSIFDDEDAELIYESHSRWGARGEYPVWTSSTYPKPLKVFRKKIPSKYLKSYRRLVSTMNSSQEEHLKKTVQGWSDDQLSLLIEKSENLDSYSFLAGIRILAGEHAYLKAKKHASDFYSSEIKEEKSEGAGPEESSQDWKTLQSRVHDLPYELFETIKSRTLEGALLGNIELDLTSQPLDARKCIRNQINTPLLSLDKATCQEHKDRIWAENLWIIPSGPVNTGGMHTIPHITRYLAQIPQEHLSKMSRLKVCFTREDYFHSGQSQKSSLEGFCDEWLLFMRLPNHAVRDHQQQKLCDTWLDKVDFIAHILDPQLPNRPPLKELILDFKDTRGPDGVFYGARLAMYLPFYTKGWENRKPLFNKDIVKVEAHTPAAAENIRRILVDKKYRWDVYDSQEEDEEFWPTM